MYEDEKRIISSPDVVWCILSASTSICTRQSHDKIQTTYHTSSEPMVLKDFKKIKGFALFKQTNKSQQLIITSPFDYLCSNSHIHLMRLLFEVFHLLVKN